MVELLFPALCSNSSKEWFFWSYKQIWETTRPDFTLCFQYTVLNWIPLAFLTFCSVFYIPILFKRKQINYTRRGTLNIWKSVLITFLFFIHCLNLSKAISDQISNQPTPPALFLQPILSGVFSIFLIYLNRLVFNKGVHSSGTLFIYWSLQLIVNIIIVYSKSIRLKISDADYFRFVTAIIEFILVLFSFLANCFADKLVLRHTLVHKKRFLDENSERQPILANHIHEKEKLKYPVCQELKASFISKISFSFPFKLVYRGYKRPVTANMLYALKEEDTCSHVVPIMDREWENEINRTNRSILKAQNKSAKGGYQKLSNENSGQNTDDSESRKKAPKPLFLKALFHTLGWRFIIAGFMKVLYDQSNFLQPSLLGFFITFMGNSDDMSWHGFFYMFCIVGVSLIRTFINQHFMYNCSLTGMRAKTAIMAIIYKKALRLPISSRKERTVGEIVNLMAVDATKFQDLPIYIHIIWASPINIAVCLYFLWQELGPAIIAGLVLLLCLLPLNAVIGSKVKALQTNQMRMKDTRIKLISEILSGIKILKLFAWEKTFEEKIKGIRENECRILRKAMYLNAFSSVAWFCTPPLVALFSFAAYVLSSPNNVLTPQKTFVSIALFNIINFPMSMLPGSILFCVQGLVSATRINNFLNEDELNPENYSISSPDENPISVINGCFSWIENEKPFLNNVNLEITEGSLVMIVGTVGSGKSSLINAVLGEMFKISGLVKRKEPIAYVPQQAWCQNRSFKDNILFGKPIVDSKYKKVLEACALLEDLKILPAGDQTEIGEKGINLSGGQKQRISLARAVYQDSAVYLLDDPLSAVDAHVGKHIFDKVLSATGMLSHTTRILVTHSLTYLPKADKIVVMKNGTISETGTYQELLKNDGAFAEFLRTYLEQEEDMLDEDETDETKEIKKEIQRTISCNEKTNKDFMNSKSRRSSSCSVLSKDKSEMSDKKSNPNKSLIEEEVAQVGGVKLAVFIYYIRSASYLLGCIALLCYVCYIIALTMGNIVLSSWSEVKTINNTQDIEARNFFLAVYGGLGVGQAVFILVQSLTLAYGMFLASKTLHNMMLRSVMRAPNLFFDTTPTGRVLNRIGKDIDTVDVTIPNVVRIWLTSGSRVISSIIIICIASPYFIIALIPLSLFYFVIQRFYICTSRQLQRIDSIRKSPIYSHFQESIVGMSSIRAYKVSKKFISKCEELTDESQMVWYLIITCNRWMQFYLEMIGNLVILLAGVFAILLRESIGPGLGGLSVSYALMITTSLAVMVRTSCDIESNVVAIERIKEYTEIESEAPWENKKNEPHANWPKYGTIEFQNYSVRYRPGLSLVLKNLNFTVRSGEKVGIIGRTGAGKSSLALALFRLIEPVEGTIKIDDVDISTIGLHDLRKKLTIIPQDPVLFSGTLRINLDPFNKYSDSELWVALEVSNLKDLFCHSNEGLDYIITENGGNLSVGQRQLVCLARALLKKTSILILDEATAAVDMETDDLIQNSIRTVFKTCTILTIAHRLNTIMDYDRIMVLNQGRLSEMDTPTKLLANENSIFFSMAKDAGLV